MQFAPGMMGDNPFAALTTIVAPAVLTNACSVLALGTGNRIARVIDQSKVLQERLKDCTDPERAEIRESLRLLSRRSQMLFQAQRLLYGSLGCFAGAALLAVVGAAAAAFAAETAFRAAATAGFVIGALGVLGLSGGCVLMVHEVRLALEQTSQAAARALADGTGT